MGNENIKLEKERDFGQILSTTFAFLKQEFKSLMKALMYYAGPFILMQTIVSVYYQKHAFNLQANMYNGFRDFSTDMILMLLLVFIFSALGYAMFLSVTYAYIKLYKEKGKDEFELPEVWTEANKYFFKILGANILFGLIIGIGFVLCIIPGVYLGVSLALIFTLIIFENKGIGDSFSRSFQLTKIQWWYTLLLLIVVFLITGIIGFIFKIPESIMSIMYVFKSTNAVYGESAGADSMPMIFYLFNAISTIATIFLNAIPLTAIALQYFNLKKLSEPQPFNE